VLIGHVTTGKGKEAAPAATATEPETATPPEPLITPSETIYLQILDFLLDAKATAVTHSPYMSDNIASPL